MASIGVAKRAAVVRMSKYSLIVFIPHQSSVVFPFLNFHEALVFMANGAIQPILQGVAVYADHHAAFLCNNDIGLYGCGFAIVIATFITIANDRI